jgi:hypothetical protein
MATDRPVDPLPDRATGSFAAWLHDRREAGAICPDRAGPTPRPPGSAPLTQ